MDRTASITHSTLVNGSEGESDSYCYSENFKIISCHVISKHLFNEISSYLIISLIAY